MAIGPAIPSHLLRRNSDPAEEQDVEEGPAPPSIGPQIPTAVQPRPQVDEESGDEDSYAPPLPPDLVTASSMSKPRVLGPTLPTREDLEDSDDDYGPAPLPAGVSAEDGPGDGVREFIEREERRQKQLEESLKPKEIKRDEWMLVPPTSSILGSLGDPTKLKARTFQRTSEDKQKSVSTLWTETPAERQARLADEVSGKRKRIEIGAGGNHREEETDEDRKRRRRDREINEIVEKHNKTKRGEALVETHKPSEAETVSTSSTSSELLKKNQAIWDRDRDMSLGGRLMDDSARAKMIRDAKGLGDRFGASKSGRYM